MWRVACGRVACDVRRVTRALRLGGIRGGGGPAEHDAISHLRGEALPAISRGLDVRPLYGPLQFRLGERVLLQTHCGNQMSNTQPYLNQTAINLHSAGIILKSS